MAVVLRRDHSPVMAAVVLLVHNRVMAPAAALPDHPRAKVRADVLPDHNRVMAPAAALPGSQAAAGALRDHRPAVAAEEAMVAATAVADKVADKAAAAVETTSSRTVSRDFSPPAASGTDPRRQEHPSGDRNITGFASLAPAPRAWKIRLPDQAPASAGA